MFAKGYRFHTLLLIVMMCVRLNDGNDSTDTSYDSTSPTDSNTVSTMGASSDTSMTTSVDTIPSHGDTSSVTHTTMSAGINTGGSPTTDSDEFTGSTVGGTNPTNGDSSSSHSSTGTGVHASTDSSTHSSGATNIVATGSGTSTHLEGTSLSSVATSPSVTGTSSTTPSVQVTNINQTYAFEITTSLSLRPGVINDSSIINQVQNLIERSFNQTSFTLSVLQVSINSSTRARALANQYLWTDIKFLLKNNSCREQCINDARINKDQSFNIDLPLENGTLVSISIKSDAKTPEEVRESSIVILQGESSPGLAAKLGMGLGISFLGVLLIGEIAFLYWKFGLSRRSRQTEYAMTSGGQS